MHFAGFHILVSRDIAGRLGVLGDFSPEIRRESLYYLVMSVRKTR